MWIGDGWIKTRRQLGVAGAALLLTADIVFHAGVPIASYGLIASLLGLGELADILGSFRVGGDQSK